MYQSLNLFSEAILHLYLNSTYLDSISENNVLSRGMQVW